MHSEPNTACHYVNQKFRVANVLILTVGVSITLSGCDQADVAREEEQVREKDPTSLALVARPLEPKMGFVGSRVCAECHGDVSESYDSHPMAHSLAGVLENPVEHYQEIQKFETFSGCEYLIEATPELVSHSERVFDERGALVFEHKESVHFAVGSGTRGRSYLINRGGLLYASPVTWYARGNKFDLSPGYSVFNHPRFSRRVSDGCMSCHSGRMATRSGGPSLFEVEPFLERAIGCEKCHGPGKEHVAFHRSGLKQNTADPIVNIANLSFDLQNAICLQCHLQGVERVLRYARSEYDFRPGDRLSDIWAVFLKGDLADSSSQSVQALSQFEQMIQSKCYQKSSDRFGCVTCHEPHSSPAPNIKANFFRLKCLECHDNQSRKCHGLADNGQQHERSCIDCHMPKLHASDVPHTSLTDHRILKQQLKSDFRLQKGKPVVKYPQLYVDAGGPLSRECEDRVRGIFMSRGAMSDKRLAKQAFVMMSPLVSIFPNDSELLDALGEVCYQLDDFVSAERYWLEVLGIQPEHEWAIEGLLLIATSKGDQQRSIQLVNRLLELNPWEEKYYRHKTKLLIDQREYHDAIKCAESGISIHPSSAPLFSDLIIACRKAREEGKAVEYEQQLKKIVQALPSHGGADR